MTKEESFINEVKHITNIPDAALSWVLNIRP